jgi:hypothetical protein
MGGIKCPKMTTLWLAMGSWTKWQLNNRQDLQKFFSSRSENQVKPPTWYWPVIAGVCALFYHVDSSIRTLQGRTLIMSQQDAEIQRLISMLINATEIDGPLSEEQLL